MANEPASRNSSFNAWWYDYKIKSGLNDNSERSKRHAEAAWSAAVSELGELPGLIVARDHECQYCRDGKKAENQGDGGVWHHVARGGDHGQFEPCRAHWYVKRIDALSAERHSPAK